ncbi:MAG: flavodoxin [Clostridia bacterium]|nr:flavodoxin [Clostridia bacterium]
MKALVVYYSMGGNTEYAARRVARQLDADLLRLEPEKEYPSSGFRKFFWGGKSAVMAETPKLKPYRLDADRYDTIIFGFPVWAGNITPPIRTFLRDNRLNAGRYAAYACQSGSGAEKAFGKLKDCLGHPLSETLILIDPKDKPDPAKDRQIDAFCQALKDDK